MSRRLTGLVCMVSLATAALGFSILALVTETSRWIIDGLTGKRKAR